MLNGSSRQEYKTNVRPNEMYNGVTPTSVNGLLLSASLVDLNYEKIAYRSREIHHQDFVGWIPQHLLSRGLGLTMCIAFYVVASNGASFIRVLTC